MNSYSTICTNKSDSTKWMGISTAGGRDGRRNDPRSSAPLLSAIGLCGLTLSPRSSAGQLCPSSARSSRIHTRARPSGRNRRPACAHGRERKEAPKIELKPSLSHTHSIFAFPTHPPGGLAARRPRASATPAPRGSSTVPFATLVSQQRCPASAFAAQSSSCPGSSRVPLGVQSK